ncbi:transcriptional regulator, TetR family [Devosia enhydra]|uniref:Transcriptional regulator, TetR family n=1 Tax=Devosia enhydra TaxID=665118 RepID=A0A1K2HWD4_9HYPH|nr:TetR/AcrR family transcriptional regulator [Devosia enhydra]SFZ83326.1 transcriptional regulator, TetR family [Devosia enhydra]
MARPRGARSQGFADRRRALLEKLAARLSEPDGHRASMRTLAESAGVSVATLRHYFDSREGLLSAYFAQSRADGDRYLQMMAATELPLDKSIAEACRWIGEAGLIPEFRALHEIGLREGLNGPTGGAYLEGVFEPTLAALEARLALHVARGEMRPADLRTAGLMLLAPLTLGTLHQKSLSGETIRPLDLDAFLAELAEAFLRAYAPPAQ